MNKKSKRIKRLNKKVKKLNERISKMNKQIEGLQDVSEGAVAVPMAEQLLAEEAIEIVAQPASNFSPEEVETASEFADEAEAVLDILEKEKEKRGKKASSRRKSRKKSRKKLKKK